MKLLMPLLLIAVAAVAAQDRVATLPDGSKVVLKADGTWSPVQTPTAASPSATPPLSAVPTPSPQSMRSVIADDPEHTFSILVGLGDKLKKSEFETEAQFRKRIQQLADTTRVSTAAGRRLSDTVYFFRNLAKYDAERQEFTFNSYYFLMGGGGRAQSGPSVKMVKRAAYGWIDDTRFEIPPISMPAAKAQATKPSLLVAVYGLPVEANRYAMGLSISLVPRHIVVFDITTGEIFAEQALEGLLDPTDVDILKL